MRLPAHPEIHTPERVGKCLDLWGRRVYLAALQFCIANYQALLAKYDFHNYAKLAAFLDDLPQDKQQHFHALLEEGCQQLS